MPRTALARGDLYALERRLRRAGFSCIAGAHEAGRGACAGPLVTAAVCLTEQGSPRLEGLTDSKLLSPQRREELYEQIRQRARSYAVVVVSPSEIDAIGVHRANLIALRRAVTGLGTRVDYALTDGFSVPGITAPNLGVWKGDRVAACIAAASIIAKVSRDRLMCQLHERFPRYDFARHKGYITPFHAQALREHGPCREHRRSFANVAATSVATVGPDLVWSSSAMGVPGSGKRAWSTMSTQAWPAEVG